MKRINNLFEKIVSEENLIKADIIARKGKPKNFGIKVHDRNRDENIKSLHKKLIEGTFKTSKYDVFKIYAPKERDIYRLPYFPDRILHHAIMNVMEPVWVSVFSNDSFSCIKGRGIHLAVRRVKETLKKDKLGTTFCLKLDVKKFYPSINHDVLKVLLRKKIKDRKLLKLLDEIIDSADGVPIGNYLSQYFANLYLTYFDHWIKEEKKVKHYFRYADDMVILSNSKAELHALIIEIQSYFQEKLKIEVKSNWQIFKIEERGLDFVGYVFYHTHIKLRKSIKKSLCRKVSKLKKKNCSQKIFNHKISPWIGWLKYCNSINLRNKILKK